MTVDPNWLLVLTGNEIGAGPADLGEKLTGLFVNCLAGHGTRPAKILFLNSAIFLTTEGSPHVDVLKKLEAEGTELVSCITCLTYHDRMERVIVGKRGDMKGTVADIAGYPKVVTL